MDRRECKLTQSGFDYAGIISTTIHGHQCQQWISQIPHKHNFGTLDYEFPDNNVSKAGQYCRNPSDDAYGPF